MIDFHKEIIRLKSIGAISGQRPIYIEIQKGEYKFVGKYLLAIDKDRLVFYQLKKNWSLMTKKANNFYIKIADILGYHYAFYKEFNKRISLKIKDDFIFTFTFPFGFDEAYGNENNAIYLMNYLKERNIFQYNEIRGENLGPKEIKKVDQYFVKEIRSPEKRKGLFGK